MHNKFTRPRPWRALLVLMLAAGGLCWQSLSWQPAARATGRPVALTAINVATFAANCTSPQTTFTQGNTLCAQVTDIDPSVTNARFDLVDPDGIIQQSSPSITSTGQTATFVLPNSGPQLKAGGWRINIAYNTDSSVAATAPFTLIVCPAITISPTTLSAGTAGQAYAPITFTPTGAFGNSAVFSVSAGSLPAGMTLSGAGVLSGTPTQTGMFGFTVQAVDLLGCTGTQTLTLVITCPTIILNPTTLPNATINTAYAQSITASPAGGNYTFAVTSGVLPTGLTLNSNGSFSGAPTQSGTFNFRVTATGWGACSSFRDYVLLVNCSGVTFSPASLPGGTPGTAYNQSVAASPAGTYSYGVTSGALPPGLTLNPANGALTGTPTTSGTFGFTLTATANGCAGSQSYTVTIACPGVSFTPTSLPNAQVGVAYNQTISVSPAGGYTFSLVTGSLPPGLTLNAATGQLSGTATVVGTYSFTMQAQAVNGCGATQAYTLAVTCPAITVNPATLPGGTTGTAYSQSLSAAPSGNYSFAVSSGSLPPGLSLSASGSLSGTPTTSGTYSFTVTASGFGSCLGSRSYSLTIGAACVTITLPALPTTGTVGVNYNGNLAATTPSASYTFSVDSGTLPPGLTIDNLFATLSGKPTAAGTYNFTLKATRSNGCTGTRTYTVVVS